MIKKVFWLLFLKKVTARRAGEILPFFFLQSFFFWGYFFKRKSVQGILLSIDSASNYSNYLSFIHFFFETRGTTRTPKTRLRSFRGTPARKSSQKEMPSALTTATPKAHIHSLRGPPTPRGSTPRGAVAFEKATQNNRWVSANIVRAKFQFTKLSSHHRMRKIYISPQLRCGMRSSFFLYRKMQKQASKVYSRASGSL